jgi:hypothetical protein
MRTDKVVIEMQLQGNETVEGWLKKNLGSVKYGRVLSIEPYVNQSRKITKDDENQKKA